MPVLSGSVFLDDRPIGRIRPQRDMQKNELSWPAIDLTVALTTFPTLVILTLLLDFNLSGRWSPTGDSTMTVLILVLVFATVSLFTICYVSYRMGFRLWAGPLALDEETVDVQAVRTDTDRMASVSAARLYTIDLTPPSYDCIMKTDDPTLPKYDDVHPGRNLQHI